MPSVQENRELASWLIANRSKIEGAMNARLGPAAPVPAAAESEALRRFRSFTSAALTRGKVAPPPLDGLRINERRVMALLDAWLASALELAPPDERSILQTSLSPLLDHFRLTIRSTQSTRRTRGTRPAPTPTVVYTCELGAAV